MADVIVTGLGRSGSSLTMQMLLAGGFPCAGSYPAFEDFKPGVVPAEEYQGRAIKLNDPWRWKTMHQDAKVIYCTRDFEQQARSQLKFAKLFCAFGPDGALRSSPTEIRKMRKLLERDDRRARRCIPAIASDLLELPFEQTLRNPAAAAATINAFLGGGLDEPAMVAEVYSARNTDCLSGFYELTLLEKAGISA